MRAGAVQLNASEDAERNLATADRLVREAVRDGAEFVLLPEKWTVFGTGEHLVAGAQSLDGPAVGWARGISRELGIDLVAGSIVERVPGAEKLSNTSIHFGPDGEQRALYRKIHMFDVEVDGVVYAESEHEQPGDEVVVSKLASGVGLGMSICYDLRFPELYRMLAVRGAEVVCSAGRVHARDHARPLGGIAAGARDREPVLHGRGQPDRRASGRLPVRRALDDRRPVGPRAGERARYRDGDRRGPRPGVAARRSGAGCRRSPTAGPDVYGWGI